MHTRTIGIIILIASVVFLTLTYFFKIQEDYHLSQLTLEKGGSCFVNGECVYENRNFTLYIVSGSVSSLVLLLGIYLIFFENKSENRPPGAAIYAPKEVDLNELDEDERRVYEFVKEHRGSAFQSELVRELGLSKVKVTRVLDQLEGLGIVERKRRGMTNIVVLK